MNKVNQCGEVKKEYEEIKALKQAFSLAYKKALEEKSSENIKRAKELKKQLEEKREALIRMIWPFESLSYREIKEQYDGQRKVLERNKIVERLSSGKMGIKAINDREYAFPNFQEITRRIRESREMLSAKIEQGFTRLLIVPFGMSLDDLIEKYREILLRHYREGKLFATKRDPLSPDVPLNLNEDNPVWMEEEYQKADIGERLKYFPELPLLPSEGWTKKEILGATEQGGWAIMFIENLPDIVIEGQGKDIKGRKQIESGATIQQYLLTMRESAYAGESGMTLEDQIIYAIQHLEKTNQLIDSDRGSGLESCQLGVCFWESHAFVTFGLSLEEETKHFFSSMSPRTSGTFSGVRTAVRIDEVGKKIKRYA